MEVVFDYIKEEAFPHGAKYIDYITPMGSDGFNTTSFPELLQGVVKDLKKCEDPMIEYSFRYEPDRQCKDLTEIIFNLLQERNERDRKVEKARVILGGIRS